MIYNPVLNTDQWQYEYPTGSGTFINLNSLLSNIASSDTINLPKDTLKFQLNITKDCFLVGQGTNSLRTTFDLSNSDAGPVITIKNCNVHISNINIYNKTDFSCEGIYIENSNVNLDSIVIDAVPGSQNYMSGIHFNKCTTGSIDSVTITDCKTGILITDCYGLNFSSCELYDNETSIDCEGSSSIIGDIPGGATTSLRTDRVHDLVIDSCSIYKSSFGIQLRNSNNISILRSKIYDVDIGIQQWPNSHNNKFRGEIFQVTSYGIKNSDTIVSDTDIHYFDSTETWWGNSLGPDNLARSVDSTKLSRGVKFDPWLRTGTEPPQSYPGTRRWIWNMLGYPQVRVELTEEDVTDCIRMSLDKYLYYITPDLDYYYFNSPTTPDGQEYELPPEIPKDSIVEVIYQPNSDIFTNLTGSGESFMLTYYMQQSGGTFLADFYIAMMYKETLERTLGIAPSYEFISRIVHGEVKEYIRVYPKSTSGIKLGIKYNRMITDYETDGTTWVRKYALAWAKEKLGRVRSKFPSAPGPTGELQLDGSTLLSESSTEKEALINEIISLGEPLGFTTG